MFHQENIDRRQGLPSKLCSIGCEKNKKHIISVVRRLAQKQELVVKISKEVQFLNSEFAEQMNGYAFEARIESALYSMTRNTKELVNFIQNMKFSIFKGLVGKLAPDIMDGNALHEAMQAISGVASKRGYYPLTKILPHIFELPCSIYIHKDRQRMDVIAHIPIAKRDTKREIFERLPLPFIIRNEMGDNEKTWGIKANAECVITDMDHELLLIL